MIDPLREHARRKEDKNGFAKLTNFAIKYHWLFTVALALFFALGFGFRTPAAVFGELREEVSGVRSEIMVNKTLTDSAIGRLESVDKEFDSQLRYLKTLSESSVIAQCKSLPRAATQYLPCRRLYNEWGID